MSEESHLIDSNRDSSLVSQAQNDKGVDSASSPQNDNSTSPKEDIPNTSPSQHEGDTSYTSPLPMRRGLGGGYPKDKAKESHKDLNRDISHFQILNSKKLLDK
ncbi:hypothetical protein CQA66_07150 [Helicobacter aurati]|uniref:Uncharacterized protein n=1 Tax=Helicobacter aurati TaxID=137778 RepID=A0A3D8J2H9_9HELI|nr:hypothetical protein [Helicobacter aurati]RDU71064.1 hypothetical protein CQA66_07150 [Helicobacter aurati]